MALPTKAFAFLTASTFSGHNSASVANVPLFQYVNWLSVPSSGRTSTPTAVPALCPSQATSFPVAASSISGVSAGVAVAIPLLPVAVCAVSFPAKIRFSSRCCVIVLKVIICLLFLRLQYPEYPSLTASLHHPPDHLHQIRRAGTAIA
ncbi:Uncharacterised protein [Salmonella enterica subsp. enterica serovar Bovismorbificans]|uniref:Uncharacterized protein n=1 Tax=Salmonella enterica subsp. enterica serovar Bovismorbificans TaxID=58097 RepID=A0A655EF32_SALET|nr:Uncharacterised protein [Salmonella enterica subsp. enterica serovar Bovismorbificans]